MYQKNDIPVSPATRQRVVVVGGGFAGLNLVQNLDKTKFDITLIDRNNYHSFPPLFYQVSSGGLDPGSISFPFRREMRRRRMKGTLYRMGNAKGFDFTNKQVITDDGIVPYDILVIAAGTTNNFFGNDTLLRRVYTLKSTCEAIRCRDEILQRLERASNARSAEEKRKLLSFVVIGGGPTGVEIAGAIGEMKRFVIKREYPMLSPDDMTITLVEGADRLLQAMSPESSRRAQSYLGQLLVNVRLGCVMKDYDGHHVELSDGSQLEAGTVIWTAGITGENFISAENENASKNMPARGIGNRIVVDEYNRVPGFDNVFALGDICIHTDESHPKGHPQLAQVAIQQACQLAKRLNSNCWDKPFVYNDLGAMATVGRNRAVVEIGKWRFGGRMAWLTWMFVHLVSLMGMRNKITVIINWIWAYCTYNSSLRLFFKLPRFPDRHQRPIKKNK